MANAGELSGHMHQRKRPTPQARIDKDLSIKEQEKCLSKNQGSLITIWSTPFISAD